jgi:predicted kinase
VAQELAILIGLPASGKSTFCRERLAATHEVVSKDALPRSASKETRQRALVSAALRAGRSVAIDNVNATRETRAWLIQEAQAAGARVIGYFFETPAKDCLERNRGREGPARVPAVAIHAAAKRLERPQADEGWDALFRVRPCTDNEGSRFTVEPIGDPVPSTTGGTQ